MAGDPRNDPNATWRQNVLSSPWIRTGLALMGFGFVVARFGLFLREFFEHEGSHKVTSTGFSIGVGVGLVLFGVFVNVAATLHHLRVTRQLHSGEYLAGRPSFLVVAIAIFLALIGLAMAVDLVILR